ncbi:ABC transporter permease [Streptomyces sp. GSL17-111]|uniref:ABC transporter permease n=1 Tax=Streptomyces sp. GSL17-111 TaxID=3121596 RepID=UPI0030F3D223
MLVHSPRARRLVHAGFALVVLPLFALPFAVILAASFSTNWSGALPSGPTFEQYATVTSGDALEALVTSLLTATAASLIALVTGTWAALAVHSMTRLRRLADSLFMLPVAVPSVVVGLALLVAFSRPPVLLNGTPSIVVMAHAVLVTGFAYQSVAAALLRLNPVYEQSAASLGASPGYVLWRVKLPLLLPSLGAATALCFALSMGELSATMMLYPPDWLPLPVAIYAATNRGLVFIGSAQAVLLMTTTLVVLLLLNRLRNRASYR